MTEIPQNQLDLILGYVMDQKTDNIRELLVRNGYAQAQSLSKTDLNTVFLKAIKDSATFRADVSAYLSGIVMDRANLPFTGQPEQTTMSFAGTPSQPKGSKKLNASGDYLNFGAADTTASADSGGGGFWGTVGGILNKDTLTNLFNTGLGVVSSKLQAKASSGSEQTALELERIRLQQIQAQSALAAATAASTAKKGLSTGAIIGIAAGGAALLGVIIYLAVKK